MATATSCPWIASLTTSSPERMERILPMSMPSTFSSVCPGRMRPASTRTPTMAGLETRNTQLGSSRTLPGKANSDALLDVQPPLLLLHPFLVVLDEPVDDVVGEDLERIVGQRVLGVREQGDVEAQDDAVLRLPIRSGVDEVLARDRPDLVLADGDLGRLALERQRLQRADGVGLDVDARLDRLDVDLGLVDHLVQRLLDVAGAALSGPPATTPSMLWHISLTPMAAETSFTESKRSLGSRISSSGLGLRMALTLVISGLPFVPRTTVSPSVQGAGVDDHVEGRARGPSPP